MPANLVERLRYRVNNPSAWDSFDQSASDDFAESAADIERLEAELDEAQSDVAALTHNTDSLLEIIDGWKARAEAAEARCDKLAEALRPFAAEADARATLALGPDIDDWPIGGSSLTLGNIRRAREALEQVGKP